MPGLVGARRGTVTIRDRNGLLELSNGTWGAPEAEFERLFASAISQHLGLNRTKFTMGSPPARSYSRIVRGNQLGG